MITRCDRCREKTGDAVRTVVTLQSAPEGNAELILEICDDCYYSLRMWIYGVNIG